MRDGLAAAGIELDDELVIHPGDCRSEDGERGIEELLSRGPLPSAIFCHTDEMAFGAIAALRHAGIRCPEDVSLVGFDDHPMARYAGLTTVTQHAHEQGARAAMSLLEALGDGAREETRPAPGSFDPDGGVGRPGDHRSCSRLAPSGAERWPPAGAGWARRIVGEAQTTAARTDKTSGRWSASMVQVSPSSVLP